MEIKEELKSNKKKTQRKTKQIERLRTITVRLSELDLLKTVLTLSIPDNS